MCVSVWKIATFIAYIAIDERENNKAKRHPMEQKSSLSKWERKKITLLNISRDTKKKLLYMQNNRLPMEMCSMTLVPTSIQLKQSAIQWINILSHWKAPYSITNKSVYILIDAHVNRTHNFIICMSKNRDMNKYYYLISLICSWLLDSDTVPNRLKGLKCEYKW